MDKTKRSKLEARGWKLGDAAEFLSLTNEERLFVEMKISLSQSLRALRQRRHMSQVRLAEKIGSSQSRVAKMESGSASVSFDLMIKTMLALGASRKDLARALSANRRQASGR